jgi:hypothetical protein
MQLRSMLLVLVVCGLTGCGAKVKLEADATVEGGEVKVYSADSPGANHKLKVEVTSDQPVTVVVYMSSDVKKVDPESILNLPKPLAKAEKTKATILEVVIPTKEEFTVAIASTAGKAKYSLKLNSQ